MPDLTGLQFQSYTRPSGHLFTGTATRQTEYGAEPVAAVHVTVPKEKIEQEWSPPGGEMGTYFPGGEPGYGGHGSMVPAFKTPEAGGQASFPLTPTPAKVSWALANPEGAAKAAPHQLLAAMAKHHGVVPVADRELSPEGSRMARSAHRRGLIQPHPENPEMKPTISQIFGHPGVTPQMLQDNLSVTQSEVRRNAERAHTYSPTEMKVARSRLFPPKEKSPALNSKQLELL